MLKKGQRVQINSGGSYYGGLYDGRTAITSEEFDDEDGYHYGLVILDIGFAGKLEEYNLTPVEPSIDNLMVGDVVKNNEDDAKKIVFIGNNDFIVSSSTEYESLHFMSKKNMIHHGYKVIFPPKDKVILTKKMISDKFGIDESLLEITN